MGIASMMAYDGDAAGIPVITGRDHTRRPRSGAQRDLALV
jgi:hypothetical protein